MLPEETTIYTGSRELLAGLTGYVLTRGVLCHFRRPEEQNVRELLKGKRRVAVLDGVVDSTNIGSIFRSAAALGVEAVILTRSCCDPLNRRVVRVSMGSVFLVPWGWCDGIGEIAAERFDTVAFALRDNSIDLRDFNPGKDSRLAMIMGAEGDGLPDEVIASAKYVVRIKMHHNVDSLNVGSAAAIAFFCFCR